MKRIKMFEDNWIDDEIADTNRRMSEFEKEHDNISKQHPNISEEDVKEIDPSRVNKLISFLDSLDDDAKVSAGDVLGYLNGWVDITSPPEDEIEVF